MHGRIRRELVGREAANFGGVISRSALSGLGVSHDHIRNEVEAGRWVLLGNQSVAAHRGPLGILARAWVAVWETGASIAALDGVTALQAAGLRGYDEAMLHLSVKHTHSVRPLAGVRIHKVIRRVEDEVLPAGPPRVRSAIAAVRAAGWAATDRQAALVLLMPVQQRLATPAQLANAVSAVMGRRRRGFIKGVVADISLGVQSLGELDFARLCRARGLPEPDRQVVRQGPRGRIYLDVRWDRHALVVEIDGVQHREGLAVSVDNLSRNAVVLGGDRVLRIDLVGLRLHEDVFMGQVAAGLGIPLGRGIPSRPGAS